MKLFLFSVLSFLLILNSGAQEEMPEEKSINNAFQGTRFVNEQSVNLANHGALLLLIQHRFGDISGGFYELFGLDQATMRIGFEYGIGRNLNIGIGRSSYLKTFDLFIKNRFARQTQNFPVTIALVAEGSLPTLRKFFPEAEDNFFSKFSGNVQLLLARTFNGFGIQLSPGFLTTGYLPAENENLSIFKLGLAGSVKVTDNVSANIEYLPYFHSNISTSKPLSLGVDIETGGHLFQLILSNSQQMFTQGIYTATYGSWENGDLFFGFNLIREFRIKYY